MAAANSTTNSQQIESNLNESSTNLTSSSTSSINSTTTTQKEENSIEDRWIFSKEQIERSPSRVDGLTYEQELKQRQEAALFISDLGQELKMVATACLFLACKVEEQPRRLSDFIGAIQYLFRKSNERTYSKEESKRYEEEIVTLESCLLQTLGFNVLINHAQTFIIKTCQMIKAPRDLAEAAYLTATNSLILTNFCVKFSSEKIACFCIFLACKGTDLIIPTSSEGLQWYQYVKHDIVEKDLENISNEYLAIYEKCLPMIQRKIGKPRSADQQQQQQQSQLQQQPQQQKENSQQQAVRQPHPVKKPVTHHDMHPPHPNQPQPGQNVNISHTNQNKQSHPSANKNSQMTNGSYHQKNQTQQQRPTQHQNLNKSLPTAAQNSSNKPHSSQSQTPIRHPSSSSLNPAKPNGTVVIKSEPTDKNIFNTNKKPTIPPPPVQQMQIKMSPSSSQNPSSSVSVTPSGTTTSMKRTNEELNNNLTTAPNKIPKYVVDQKSAS